MKATGRLLSSFSQQLDSTVCGTNKREGSNELAIKDTKAMHFLVRWSVFLPPAPNYKALA